MLARNPAKPSGIFEVPTEFKFAVLCLLLSWLGFILLLDL